MSGICSEHRDHDPDCPRCTALPVEDGWESNGEALTELRRMASHANHHKKPSRSQQRRKAIQDQEGD